MAENNGGSASNSLAGINSDRLFLGSCMSLISTAVIFGVVTSIMGDFKSVFALSNAEVGWVGGATMWGFTISIFVFGPLCDAIGMGRLLRFSLVCHIVGPLLMIFAPHFGSGFAALLAGALITALANGTVEAVCNPLVATIYPDKKTEKLNKFHVWFPGGIVIGGLAAFAIDKVMPENATFLGMAAWQVKLSLILLPTVIYGVIFTGQKFPVTERVQSGLSFGDMVTATVCRPLFIILFICMSITASLELGPGRWMAAVMEPVMNEISGANAGILVLVYGSTLMAILRFFAGPVVHRLSPTGLLFSSAVLGGIGLFALTYAQSLPMIFLAATVFYIGVCYFWPTMLGVTSERVPKGGSLAMALMGGWGMAVVGLVTVPLMGSITDRAGHDLLPPQETIQVIQKGAVALPLIKASGEGDAIKNIDGAIELVTEVAGGVTGGELPKVTTAKALRFIAKYAADDDLGAQAAALIGPADEEGGLVSFRCVAATAIILAIIFGAMYAQDRKRGGYQIEHISGGAPGE